jgi:hypothetical protein
MKITTTYFKILFVICLTSCTQPKPEQIARASGLSQQYIQTKVFRLASYQKLRQPGAPVNIYIEGDGHAIIRRTRISNDPTPHSPLVLQMAALDPNANVVYLARPCQHAPQDLSSVCDSKYWSTARYSTPVVAAIDAAISNIKTQINPSKINLIGYSGGGAIAVLVAAQRADISSIRTVAGNLDLIAMQNFHGTLPLTESLDPLDVAQKINHIPQLHFVGSADQVVPRKVVENFCAKAGIKQQCIISIPKVEHNDGWLEYWSQLLKYIP